MNPSFNLAKWNSLREPRFQDINYAQFKKLSIKPLIIIVVVNEIEKKAVLSSLKSFKASSSKYKITYNKQTYFLGVFGIVPSVVIQTGMGIDGPRDATLSINEAIRAWKVNVVIAIGVAMGLKHKSQKLGDVLVSQTIQNYNKTKITPNGEIDRGARPTSSILLYDRFKNQSNWKYYDAQNNKCKIHYGLIITGGSVVNHSLRTVQLKVKYPDAIGNEMEASGVWAASEREGVHWIIVKGICDWGMHKNDKSQPLAASAAVSLCLHVFKSETALNGIVKHKFEVSKHTYSTQINSLKLHYFRDYKHLSTSQIALKTGISEIRIKELEAFNTTIKYDYSEFPKSSPQEIKKLESVVCEGRHILTVEKSPKDYMGYLLSHYYKTRLRQTYNNIKVIVFDFDGTLTNSQRNSHNTWQRIWLKLGYSIKDCNNLHEKFSRHEFDHQTWCNITCERFQTKNMTKKILTEVANEIILMEGTIPTLKKLKDNDIHLYIASGSIRDVIINVIGENNVYLFEEIKANNMEFDKNGYLKRIIGTKYDFIGKSEFIERISNSLNINPYNILFIGNSNNDQLAYKSGAVTLCVNPIETDPENKKVWHNTIRNMENLNEILEYIDI